MLLESPSDNIPFGYCKSHPDCKSIEPDVSLKHLRDILAKIRYCKPAVFLDRDGTINEECGYLRNPEKVKLRPTVGEAIFRLNQNNLPVIIITNQSAMSLKTNPLTKTAFGKVNEAIWSDLETYGAHVDMLYYCPHSSLRNPKCSCRCINRSMSHS